MKNHFTHSYLLALALAPCLLALSACKVPGTSIKSDPLSTEFLPETSECASQESDSTYRGEYGIRQLNGDEKDFFVCPYYGPDADLSTTLDAVLECAREGTHFQFKFGYGIDRGSFRSYDFSSVSESAISLEVWRGEKELENSSADSLEQAEVKTFLAKTEETLAQFWKDENVVTIGSDLSGDGVYPYESRQKQFPCLLSDSVSYESLMPASDSKRRFSLSYYVKATPKEGYLPGGIGALHAEIHLYGAASAGKIYLFQDANAANRFYQSL